MTVLPEELKEGDRQGSGAEGVRDQDAAKIFVETQLELEEVEGGDELGGAVGQDLDDPFGLRARKAALLELLNCYRLIGGRVALAIGMYTYGITST